MKLLLFRFIVLILLISACSKKELLKPDLKKRRAFVKVKFTPEIPLNKENLNSFPFTIYCTRNNGKQKIYNSSEIYQGENGSVHNIERKFIVKTTGGVYKNGNIYIDRKIITGNNNTLFIKIKGKDKHRFASDSFALSLPYVEKISLSVDDQQIIAPGFKFNTKILAHFNTGKVIEVNRLNADLYKMEIDQKTISPLSGYELPSHLLKEDLFCKVRYLPDTNISDEISIPVKYNGSYDVEYKGQNGIDGSSGSNAWGTYERNGRDGGKGQNGQKGRPGPRVRVFATTFTLNNKLLLKIKSVTEEGKADIRYIDPSAGKVTIISKGGKGGDGGNGGNGSSGSDATEKESAGYGGQGGTGGDGGEGGRGGAIKVYADSATAPYLNSLVLKSTGGEGGSAGIGGRNGYDGNKNKKGAGSFILGLLNLLLPGRGSSGYKGYQGEQGPDPEIVILNHARLKELMDTQDRNNDMERPVLVRPNDAKGPY